MSGCLSSSMTGSTDAGPLQPQEDPAPLPVARPPSSYDRRPISLSEDNGSSTRRGGGGRHRHQPRRRMTSAPPSGQAIQLTPLWEHVVRTRRFPSEVDTQATFVEISERLRDPEWEVRQHALRVLMDVLPTLNFDVVDKVMQPVVPELINNLGHPAPAVRKGALDTLRVYLVHSPNRENMVKNILHDGLNRPDAHNPFQTNVTTGVILSAPLLLFPSTNSPPPTTQIIKDATIAFASRLVQVPHQEAVLKSLMKIRDVVGEEEFESYLADYDDKLKKNIDVLSKIYNIKPSKKKQEKNHTQDIIKADPKERTFDKSWDSDSDTSGIAEEEDEMPNAGGGAIPARVLLETEIKFNEETAITMTILEEKDDDDSEDNGRRKNKTGNDDVVDDLSSADRRKTPRRVHFGGEIVKLRTPDSDETESGEITPKTRIPLPVSPATKMPETRRRPSSQPSSPHAEKRGSKRASRSASSSPRREYTHNAQLSPKKSILTRTSAPLILINSATEETKNAKKVRKSGEAISENQVSRVTNSSQEIKETSKKEEVLVQAASPLASSEDRLENSQDENDASKSAQVATTEASKNTLSKEEQAMILERDDHANANESNESNVSEGNISSRQERNYTATKLSSPERKKISQENKDEGEPSTNIFSYNSNSFPFGSPVNDQCNTRTDSMIDFFDDDDDDDNDERDVRTFGMITDNHAVKYGDGKDFARNSDGERRKEWRSQHDKKEGNTSEGNESVTCSSSEGEGKPQEPSWEELGLVGQEVLDDLHNKDDWRARVRGLERVASALRTSSALIAIESRLGSLLHAVLGGERSCRVAAAGLAVAKVVVAGVSDNALKKKLPQLAWGLSRQGGSSAAQLARVAMLRLKPSLLLEQFLQPHCLSARNAKTRENSLQLLIYSLVTFPSTEFKLETIASRVATTVADRRRRVRQAALDTLAVLGQIYDPEEVLEAGRRAADGSPDSEAIVAAIRARLARKSLPMVSADGLVVYGLQVSPTVQITTGPDVDWIVAGSGSVSPGTGRSRGQIIATSRSAQGRSSRNNVLNNHENMWIERPNLVAMGVGLPSKTEHSMAWQILQSRINNNHEREIKGPNGRNVNTGVSSNANLRLEEQLQSFYTPNQYDFVRTDAKSRREISDNYEQKARNRRDVNEAAKEKESTVLRGESKIPVLSTRERPKITSQNRDKSLNLEHVNSNSRKQTTDALDSNRNRINSRQEDVRSYAAIHQRRKRFQQEESQTLNQTFDSHSNGYQSASYAKALGATSREYGGTAGNREAIFSDDNSHGYGRFVDTDKFADENESSSCVGGHQRSLPRNMQQQTLVETYNSVLERQRKLTDRNAYRPLQTAPSRVYHDSQNLDPQVSADNDRNAMYRPKDRRAKEATAQQRTEMDLISSDPQRNGCPFSESFANPHRRRLRSLSPSQLHRSRQSVKLASNRFHAASMYDIDKATTMNEEEYNARNRRHFSPEAKGYHVKGSNREESRYQEFLRSFSISARERPKSASSTSSDVSRNDRPVHRGESQDATLRDYNGNDNSGSSTPRSRDVGDPAFDVITQQTATNRQGATRDDVDSFFTPLDPSKVEYPIETANAPTVDEASKEWSSEDDMKLTSRIGSISRHSNHDELIAVDENCNRSTESSSGVPEQPENDRTSARRRSIVPALPIERIPPYEDAKVFKESLQSKAAMSPKSSESLYLSPNHSAHHSPIPNSPSNRNSRCGSRNLTEDPRDFSEERLSASTVPDEDASIRALDTVGHPPIDISMTSDSPAIIIASRPHSHESVEHVENANKINVQESTEEESSVNDTLEDRQSKDSASDTNMEPGILKIESEPVKDVERRRMPSKVPVRGASRCRMLSSKRTAEKPSEKAKRMVQQCFTQLENKDWEVTIKGLKTLSQISKQHPEGLDMCATGTLGRLLGRHIKNLRSQVARAACLAAGDVFGSQIRGIDQDLDDIAGPLLHRTADTNRFLRADSNAALDQMMQYLPPHKTIAIIVLRGASHQNSIVRAATARLLSDITDRIGPDHIMILPRDVRDKMLNAGAKLLMDGNLDARNHAKRMFRRLTRCDGFRKALTDAVPETTLRHIDKTLKTL